jgi:hypothetical protein
MGALRHWVPPPGPDLRPYGAFAPSIDPPRLPPIRQASIHSGNVNAAVSHHRSYSLIERGARLDIHCFRSSPAERMTL